jgi:amino acid adenylation domain-containing protein
MPPIISSSDGTSRLSSAIYGRFLPEPLRSWSGTSTDYPRNSTVVTLFERIAKENPGRVALIQGDIEVTYEDLNRRANRLAHRLCLAGVTLETLVPCCFERSIEMVVAFLAVLKSGAAYVPVDPTYPQARKHLMLEDAGKHVLLTRRSLVSSFHLSQSTQVVLLDDESEDFSSTGSDENPRQVAGPTKLAYVMYTSGSTGQPKGVMIEHRGIVRLVRDTNYCHFGSDEIFLQFAPPSFDASTFEVWGALLNGGRLVLMPSETSSLEDLVRAVRQYGVTTLWLTAGLFHLIVEEHPGALKSLRQLLAGGDVLSPRHSRLFLEHAPETALINGYGPTENTTFTSCHNMRVGDDIPESIPIGKPVANTRVYILDPDMNPVPAGEVGELYAGGDGVARGYLNAPDATLGKFLTDPFAAQPHQRMYRTGDLARWRSDGSIEFAGRLDNQVKVLGYRIEPAEIESVILRHGQVKQACVVARMENGSKRLAAFFVPSNSAPTPEELRDFVGSQLPQHMVPAFFVALPSLPLSQNGKVDRAALADRDVVSKAGPAAQGIPESDLERTMVQLWQRILKVPKVGLDENFFDLGGDSLLLVAVHSNLQKILQTQIPLTDLFEFPTVRKLAQHLGRHESTPGTTSDAKDLGQRQREAFARFRSQRSGGGS